MASDSPDNLLACYRDLGVSRGRTVFIASDFGRMLTDPRADRRTVLEAHLTALREIVGAEGTIVVPTATLNLCHTHIVFDPRTTPSHQIGAFSEFVRRQPEARRSFHPFWSLGALGGRARELVEDVSRHAFGMESVWSRLIEADSLSLHIGIQPRLSISVIHHIELVCGVPYRYTKEFMHPVQRGEKVSVEPFYHFVRYLESDIVRDKNRRIFDHFAALGTVSEQPCGRGAIWSFPLADFYETTRRYLARNLYAWCEEEPSLRPYRR